MEKGPNKSTHSQFILYVQKSQCLFKVLNKEQHVNLITSYRKTYVRNMYVYSLPNNRILEFSKIFTHYTLLSTTLVLCSNI